MTRTEKKTRGSKRSYRKRPYVLRSKHNASSSSDWDRLIDSIKADFWRKSRSLRIDKNGNRLQGFKCRCRSGDCSIFGRLRGCGGDIVAFEVSAGSCKRSEGIVWGLPRSTKTLLEIISSGHTFMAVKQSRLMQTCHRQLTMFAQNTSTHSYHDQV